MSTTGALVKYKDGTQHRVFWNHVDCDRYTVSVTSIGKDGYIQSQNDHEGETYPFDYIEHVLDMAIERGARVTKLS